MVTITFDSPQNLWFLIAIPMLFVSHFYLLRHSKKKALAFANFIALKRATGQKYITKNYTILFLRLMILTFAIFAVAQTSMWYEAETNDNEYVIALDTSASMSAQDIEPTRIAAAKENAKDFIEKVRGTTRIGLVSFSGVTFIEQPLSDDYDAILSALDRIEIEASGTDIPGAIITSTNLLEVSERGKAIILITDGSSTIETFESKSLQRAIQYAMIKRVRIYTIGVGSEGGVLGYLPTYYNISATYNENNLQFIADETGGTYYAVETSADLANAYEHLLSLESTSLLKRDLTSGFMLVTLMLIFVEWGLLNTRFRSLP